MSSFTTGVVRHVLPNGLTILVQSDDSAPVIAVVTHVRAGYFDEPDEWVGISHVLEHMFFKGTRRRGPGDLARETQMLGGYLNASTIYDKTVYYTVLPSTPGALERAVDIQSDALMHAALEQGELSRELEVVIQEAKRKLDNPGAVATETLFQLLFQVHRMRRWRIGTEDGLRRLDASALRSYYRTRYTPDRTVIGVAGNLDPDEALDLCVRTYQDWRIPPSAVPGSPPEPDGRHAGFKLLSGDIAKPLAVIGWRTTGELDPDTPALDMAASVLGSGRGSWLSRFVRTPGLAASVSASHYTPAEVGVFDFTLQGDPATLDRAVQRTLSLAGRLADEGPDATEISRVQSLTRMRWARAFETMDGRAASLCEFEALGGYALADEIFDRTMAVTGDDIRRVASQYLQPAVASAVFYLPGAGATTSPAWPPSPDGRDLQVRSPEPAELEEGTGAAGRERNEVGQVVHVALKGMDLLVRSKRGTGLVTLGLFIPGVRDEEDDSNAGISWLLARASLRGAGGLSAEELSLAAESLGGSISPSAGLEAVGWSITVPVAGLSRAAALLDIVARHPTLDPEQVRIERELQAADAARIRDDMYRYPLQRVLGVAFPRDPYGLPPLGAPEQVLRMDAAKLKGWSQGLTRRRAVVIAVGDLDTDELIDRTAHVGDWDGGLTPRRVEVPRFRTGEHVETREKAQSALAMAFPGAASGTARRFAIEVLGDFLSGLAGRLFDVLREQRALAYTVMASPWAHRRAGAVLTYIATSPEREDEARNAMLEALEDVASGNVTEPELERARNYAAGLVEIGRQTSGALVGEILGAWVDEQLDEVPDLPAKLRAVTVEEVVGEAARIFRHARAEFVVRGNAEGSADRRVGGS